MVICGQTFDFSPLNANDIERLETANEKMQRAGESELEQFRRGGVRICDHMRAQARLVIRQYQAGHQRRDPRHKQHDGGRRKPYLGLCEIGRQSTGRDCKISGQHRLGI